MDGLLKVLSEEEREGSLDLARMDMAGSTLTFESQRGGVQSELVQMWLARWQIQEALRDNRKTAVVIEERGERHVE